jgi:phage gp46-like protein
MTDIALTYVPEFMAWDISLDGSDLAVDEGLQTAAVLSLFCDRLANADDPLPPGSGRRGWWGDRVAPLARPAQGNGANPDRIGSRLWILMQQTQHPSLLPQVKDILAEALAWMTEDGWASSLDIAASFPRRGWLGYTITAHKPDGTAVSLTRQVPWGI